MFKKKETHNEAYVRLNNLFQTIAEQKNMEMIGMELAPTFHLTAKDSWDLTIRFRQKKRKK